MASPAEEDLEEEYDDDFADDTGEVKEEYDDDFADDTGEVKEEYEESEDGKKSEAEDPDNAEPLSPEAPKDDFHKVESFPADAIEAEVMGAAVEPGLDMSGRLDRLLSMPSFGELDESAGDVLCAELEAADAGDNDGTQLAAPEELEQIDTQTSKDEEGVGDGEERQIGMFVGAPQESDLPSDYRSPEADLPLEGNHKDGDGKDEASNLVMQDPEAPAEPQGGDSEEDKQKMLQLQQGAMGDTTASNFMGDTTASNFELSPKDEEDADVAKEIGEWQPHPDMQDEKKTEEKDEEMELGDKDGEGGQQPKDELETEKDGVQSEIPEKDAEEEEEAAERDPAEQEAVDNEAGENEAVEKESVEKQTAEKEAAEKEAVEKESVGAAEEVEKKELLVEPAATVLQPPAHMSNADAEQEEARIGSQHLSSINTSPEATQARRDDFEGAHLTAKDHLKRGLCGQRSESEAEKFLALLRQKGDGSVGIAWRRYFDTDGDGALSFPEFCIALVAVGYKGDVLALWREFGGDSCNEMGLEVLDPDSALFLTVFYEWSVQKFGGPLELFAVFDEDGSDSLEKNEFVEGLRDSGFFDQPNLIAALDCEEKILHTLYPLLDVTGTGVIQPDQLLFLERDEGKKKEWDRILQKKRDGQFGVFASEDDSNEALGYIKDLCYTTTRGGKEHWSLMPYNPIMGGLPPRALRKQPLSNGKPTERLPNIGPSSIPPSQRPVPRFMRDFHKAKRQGKLVGKAAKASRDTCLGDGTEGFLDRQDAEKWAKSFRGSQGPTPGWEFPTIISRPVTPEEDKQMAGKAMDALEAEVATRPSTNATVDPDALRGATPHFANVGRVSNFGLNPRAVGSATICGSRPLSRSLSVGWARNNADAEKISQRRKAYGSPSGSFSGFVPRPPKPSLEALHQLQATYGTAGQLIKMSAMAGCASAPALSQHGSTRGGGHDSSEFSPLSHHHFFSDRKALGMWNHYAPT